MSRVAVVADSNCGIMPERGRQLGVSIVPMPIIIDEVTYYENVDLTADTFYKKQKEGSEISSSQPAPESILKIWDELLETHDEVVYIPMSASLSGSCQSALAFAEEYEGKVYVVNNYRISVTQVQAVLDAKYLAEQGKSGKEIKDILEEEALDASIYICVDTLEYLRKGGRITAAGAAIGTALNIKPVLSIQGGKLDAYAKVRGRKGAFRTMCKALRKDLDTRFAELYKNGELMFGIANTYMPEEELEQWKAEFQKEFPGEEILYAPLTLSIGCHIGPGGLGIAAFRKHN